ncbi:DEAD/DEAH box helicase [Microbacterium nymphoidis]|uniref:DEAD/DEAH box helicase n=1 Tax=Microbacterium nymphoidis TaxID=2898586 RepID=UPI001E32CE4F|nr:DEAD/DEAH box helicase [Microbacterium nymphoidis]MCD2499997.1 DEAD/DEAH box helicase [Microbacterium nymphoidis]
MPKNTRQGGRAPKNFDPRYGERAKASKGAKTIGRGHRGYSDPAENAGKRRWSSAEKAGRDEAVRISSGRDDRTTRGDLRDDYAGSGRVRRDDDFRANRGGDNRAGRSDDRSARHARDERFSRDDRGARSSDRFSRDDHGARSGDRFSRDDRGARSGDRFSREARSGDRFSRDDRGFSRDDRGFSRDDRGARSGDRFSRDGRPSRSFDDRAARPGRDARSFDDRGSRFRDERVSRDDRASRFDRDARAPRFEDRSSRDHRPVRSFDDRGSRFARDERPQREDRGSRFRDERPQRDGRPARSFDDRPRRSFDDRPQRTSGNRSDWNADAKKAAFQDNEDIVRERLNAEAVTADDVADVTFDSLGLGQNIVRVLGELGAERPFPIQAATIPVILEGRDTLGRGRTGSGKTIAFGAPLVESVLRAKAGVKREFGRAPSALILAPTRELALQIDRTIQPIARSVGLFTTQIYGGVPQARQVGALKKGVDIIIGTPGRIEDLVNQGKLDLSQVQVAVLDEADHMCELGFLEPVQRILRQVADGAQKLMFSATLDTEVEALVNEFLVNPAVYEVAGEDQNSGTIEHRVLVIEHRDKADILTELVDREGKTIVFTRTRAYAEMLAEQFEDAGISAVALHGDLNQAKRTRNLQKMSSGRANVLVATDVAARGIHVDDIDLVIQADAPDEYKTYLHRSGRTGRAGNTGRVVTLITRARKRRIAELLERAEIAAPFEEARPGDDILDELTGGMTLEQLTA